MSSLPAPEHVTSLISLVPQSLSRATVAVKSKTSAPQSAQSTKPVTQPTGTVLPVKQAPSASFIGDRLSTPSAAAVSNSVIDDSDDEGGHAADFFSLDAADKPATYPAAFKSSDSIDVRWTGSASRAAPATAFVPPEIANVSAASADIVWNATNYTSPITNLPPVSDTAMVRTFLLLDAGSRLFCS